MEPRKTIETHLYLLLAIMVMINSSPLDAATNFGNKTDQLALLEFKSQIADGILSSWNESRPHCQWQGVTCGHKHQRVTVLDLSSKDLSGSISPHIGNLSFLKYIDLGDNRLHGEIPHEIGRLFRLKHLNLTKNTLEGEIPMNLSNCTELVKLALNTNHFRGEIPHSFEYGTGSDVSPCGDIYSYGIILLEMMTGRRPTDDIFTEGLNLHKYVKRALPKHVWQIIDPVIHGIQQVAETEDNLETSNDDIQEREIHGEHIESSSHQDIKLKACIISILSIGLACSEESPTKRLDINGVTRELHRIKDTILGCERRRNC